MPAYNTKPTLSFGGFNAERLMRWRAPLAFWGIGAGAAVSLFLSDVPIFQRDVLKKIPVVASYFEDTTPASDKPF